MSQFLQQIATTDNNEKDSDKTKKYEDQCNWQGLEFLIAKLKMSKSDKAIPTLQQPCC